MSRSWAGFVCALCFPAAAALSQGRPVAALTVTIDTTHPGSAIPADFSGLSFERGALNYRNAGASGYIFSPSNWQLVTLFQNLSIKNLRIGGGSVDDEIPVGTGSDGYAGIDNLFGFAKAAGVMVLYSQRLLNPAAKPIPSLQTDDTQSTQYIWQNYRPYVSSFAIGTADGRIQIFGIGGNQDLWSNWQQTPGGAWNGWADFGGHGLRFYSGQ